MLWSGERNATLCSLSRIAVKMSVLLKMSTEATRPKQQQKELQPAQLTKGVTSEEKNFKSHKNRLRLQRARRYFEGKIKNTVKR